MRIEESRMERVKTIGEVLTIIGKIVLRISANGVTILFIMMVSDTLSTDNAIVGRLWCHAMRVVPPHWKIKFPMLSGIRELWGD